MLIIFSSLLPAEWYTDLVTNYADKSNIQEEVINKMGNVSSQPSIQSIVP